MVFGDALKALLITNKIVQRTCIVMFAARIVVFSGSVEAESEVRVAAPRGSKKSVDKCKVKRKFRNQ